ncbi:MAG: GDSL-type esterase/lipase family protein [Candidatus Delongbacteria bacterium]|nr:GDSL-type esterase/lipase family protein [Candidatus Delongbacteria bacterium]
MLGDSMTEFTHWNELLGRKDVVNRGISGDITEGMLNRLENIIKVQPKYCFFMGGINDIIYNVSYEKTIDNIESITKELRQEGITPVLQTIIYTGRSFRNCQTINILVARLNEGIKIIAEKNSCFYLDINNGLTEQGILKDQFTYDGLHLNAEGYKVWGCFISEFLISQEE